jgi:hypothetical protein
LVLHHACGQGQLACQERPSRHPAEAAFSIPYPVKWNFTVLRRAVKFVGNIS